MNVNYAAIAARAEHRCEYCHVPEAAFNFAFEVEHIHPSASGGSDDALKLALGCRSCNLYKSAATAGDDADTGERVPLFNPRISEWGEHFAVEADRRIAGLTASARATIEKLRINSPRQLAARRLRTVLRLFP